MICPSCGKENRVGERSCCYCLSALHIDIEALFRSVQEGTYIPNQSTYNVQEKKSIEAKPPEEELDLLSEEFLVPISSQRDYTELLSLCATLEHAHDEAKEASILRAIAKEALQKSRGLGRLEPMYWGNKPLALVVQGIQDEMAWKELMELFEIPIFLAKFISTHVLVEIVAHGTSREELQRKAVSYTNKYSARAKVVSKEMLYQEPPPLACVGIRGTSFRVVDAPLWRETRDDGMEEDLRASPFLAVVGMVEEQSFRSVSYQEARSFGRRRTEQKQEKHMEKKVGVIDLHSGDMVIRIVEGVTDFSSLPGYEKGAQRKSFQNLVGLLPVWLNNIVVLPSKTVRVRSDAPQERYAHAWGDWERYSYSARLLFSS